MIPEGGSNELGVAGCVEIASSLNWPATAGQKYLATACGTGATLAGLIKGLKISQRQTDVKLIGVAVLKGADFLTARINQWLAADSAGTYADWNICTNYHGGGYGKCDRQLTEFLGWFAAQTTVPVEPVYSGKLFYGLFDLIKRGELPTNSEILALHCGGIQEQFGN